MTLTKLGAARQQLGTALALFIDDCDPVSVQVLACGGGEVAEHLSAEAGQQPFAQHSVEALPNTTRRDFKRIRNQYWNALKHATTRKDVTREDEELLVDFSDHQNDAALFVGWYDYSNAAAMLPLEAQVFQLWFFAMYPEKVSMARDDVVQKSIELFGHLAEVDRAEAKRRLRSVIEEYRADPDVMSDPRTEKLPLIAKRDNP